MFLLVYDLVMTKEWPADSQHHNTKLKAYSRWLGPKWNVLAVALVGVLALNAFVVFDAIQDRERFLLQAEQRAEAIAVQVQRQFETAIDTVDQTLLRLKDAMMARSFSSGETLKTYLRQVSQSIPYIRSLFVTDSAGNLIESSLPPPFRPNNLSDHPYFSHHQSQPSGGLYIGPMVVGDNTRLWTLPLTRRLDNERGDFLGVVIAGIEPRRLGEYLEAYDAGKNGRIEVRLADGSLVAAPSSSPPDFGSVDTYLTGLLADQMGRSASMLRHADQPGAHPHIHALNWMRGGSLFVHVLLDQDEVLSIWEQDLIFRLGYLAFTSLLILGMAVWLGQQIESRMAADADLRRSKARLLEAQRIAKLGHWEWTIASGTLWWSDQVYAMFGLERLKEEPTYSRFIGAIHRDDRERVINAVNGSLISKTRYAVDHRIVRPNGVVRHVHEQGEVIKGADGEPVRMVGTVIDITERVEAEIRLAHASRLGELGKMAASLAHELGQPLAAIKVSIANGLLRLSRGQARPEDHQRLYETMDQQIQRLYGIIEETRSFAYQDPQPVQIFSSRDSLDRALANVQERMAKSEIDVQFIPACSKDKPCMVLGQAGQLERVFINLLLNACDALEDRPSGRRMSVTCAPDPDGNRVIMRFENNGPPISDEILAKLFDPFVTTKPSDRGTGLGLSICHGIVTGFGGKISGENIAGGVRFTVELPLQHSESTAQALTAETVNLAGLNILVVDDDSVMRNLLCDYLAEKSAKLAGAANGREALEKLENFQADIILSDLAMPVLAGDELALAVRERHAAAKVIIMTAKQLTDEEKRHLERSGAVAIIAKPFAVEDVLAHITRSL